MDNVGKTKSSDAESLPAKAIISTALDIWKDQGKQHRISIAGNSMLPLMRDGDRVMVAHGNAGVQPGDVIVFWQSERLMVHRVIQIDVAREYSQFLTKGDNVSSFDPPVVVDQIIGRVMAIQRGDREISIDTRWWRMFGYWVARSTLSWYRLLAIGQHIKQRLIGRQPNRQTAKIQQMVRSIPSRLFKLWLAVIHRWKV